MGHCSVVIRDSLPVVRGLALAALLTTVAAACAPAAAPAASASTAPGTAGAATATPVRRVALKVNWTAQTGANSGLWTAFEAGYFAEEGLDVELVNIPSSNRSIAALLAKDVQIGWADAGNLIDAIVQGGDVRAIQAVTNRLVFSVMTKPEIRSPSDLKGKRIGITSRGSSTHTAGVQALKVWGLTERDVSFVPLQEVPNILAGLIAGQLDAGVVSPPTNTRAKAAGFSELINLAVDGPNYPSVLVAATGEWVAANGDVVKRFIKAYSRGVSRFRTDKAFGTQAINKYLKLTDQAVLDDTWTQFSRYLELPPYVRGIEAVIADTAERTPAAKDIKPEQAFDARYVKELDDEGFFRGLK